MSTIESSPLLPSNQPETRIDLPIHHNERRNGHHPFTKKNLLTVKVIGIVFLSPILVALAITVKVKYRKDQRPEDYYLHWRIEEAIPWVIVCSVISFYFCTGLIRRSPSLTNNNNNNNNNNIRNRNNSNNLYLLLSAFAVHLSIGAWPTAKVVEGVSILFAPKGKCTSYKRGWQSGPETSQPDRDDCLDWARGFERWVWAYLVLMGIFAIVHLLLALGYLLQVWMKMKPVWKKVDAGDGDDDGRAGWEATFPTCGVVVKVNKVERSGSVEE